MSRSARGKNGVGLSHQVAYGANGTNDYPALVLLNLILGGDAPSRLFKHLREEEGLCYYIASHIEALSGLLFVTAGIEASAYPEVRDKVKDSSKRCVLGPLIREKSKQPGAC